MIEAPTYCEVGPHRYEIKWDYTFTERFDVSGQCDDDWLVIRVSKQNCGINFPITKKLQVLIHEIMHASDWQTGKLMFEGDENDRKMDGVASLLLQALLSNPVIPGMLLEEAKRRAAEVRS